MLYAERFCHIDRIVCFTRTINKLYQSYKFQNKSLLNPCVCFKRNCLISKTALSPKPPEDLVPSCAPDMEYLFETLPYLEIFILALTGDGNCAEVLWTFLGISIPGWVLIGLIIMCSYVIYALIYANEIHSHK